MTQAQRKAVRAGWNARHKLKSIVLRDCSCGHCADCKARQTPEERLRMHKAEIGNETYSPLLSTLVGIGAGRSFGLSVTTVNNGRRVGPKGHGPSTGSFGQ